MGIRCRLALWDQPPGIAAGCPITSDPGRHFTARKPSDMNTPKLAPPGLGSVTALEPQVTRGLVLMLLAVLVSPMIDIFSKLAVRSISPVEVTAGFRRQERDTVTMSRVDARTGRLGACGPGISPRHGLDFRPQPMVNAA